jgi:hypothetical protein
VGGVDAPQDSAADLAVDLLKCRSKAQPGKHASEHRGSSRRIVRIEGTITLRPFRLFTILQKISSNRLKSSGARSDNPI